MRRARRAAAPLLVALALGCAHARTVPALSLGPLPSPGAASFDAITSEVSARGYPPLDADPVHGTFRVLALSSPRGVPYTFTFQFSREGYVVVTPAGPRARPSGDGAWELPAAVGLEYMQLVSALAERVGPASEGGR